MTVFVVTAGIATSMYAAFEQFVTLFFAEMKLLGATGLGAFMLSAVFSLTTGGVTERRNDLVVIVSLQLRANSFIR